MEQTSNDASVERTYLLEKESGKLDSQTSNLYSKYLLISLSFGITVGKTFRDTISNLKQAGYSNNETYT
jgi:hypothetical protein